MTKKSLISNIALTVDGNEINDHEEWYYRIRSIEYASYNTFECQDHHDHRMTAGSLPFPWKLHHILDDATHYNFEEIISWVADQPCLKVHARSRVV